MPAPDPLEVHDAALITIKRYGRRAAEVAEEVLEISLKPEFSKAVLAEIRRILDETHH